MKAVTCDKGCRLPPDGDLEQTFPRIENREIYSIIEFIHGCNGNFLDGM
jgi:hypothetical protein